MAADPVCRWLPWSADAMAPGTVRLLCLPHSGGSASTFRPWMRQFAGAAFAVCPVEYPGRGVRPDEPPPSSVEEVAAALRRDLRGWLDAAPYAILGHSLGAFVGYSLVSAIEASPGSRQPDRLVLCAARPPAAGRVSPWHLLGRASLVERLRTLGGMAERALNNDEVLDEILPVIRADLAAAEMWQEARGHPPIETPLVALGGAEDPMAPAASLAEWRAYARGGFTLEVLPGSHFFLHTHRARVLDLALGDAITGSLVQSPAARHAGENGV